MCIGGPALVYYVSPTEDELFKVSIATLASPARPDQVPDGTVSRNITQSYRRDPWQIGTADKKSLTNLLAG